MPLPTSRANLQDRFRPSFEAFVRKEWPLAKQLIDTWWKDYKDWERDDTFSAAFYDSRMTSRSWFGKLNTIEELRPDADRTVSKKGVRGDKKNWKTDPVVTDFDRYGYLRNAGMASLAQRTNPANFYPAPSLNEMSGKYKLGLHDMSVTLLNPNKAIREQAHSKDNGTIFSFMPLSDPLDQAVFQTLNRTAKSLLRERPELYELVRAYRNSMTRIKLACEHDMGTGFTAVERADRPGYKLSYTIGNVAKVIDDEKTVIRPGGGAVKQVPITPEILKARQDSALDFRAIVTRQVFDHTEIIVAFRQHAGKFPVFAQLNSEDKCFEPYRQHGLPTIDASISDPPPLLVLRQRGG